MFRRGRIWTKTVDRPRELAQVRASYRYLLRNPLLWVTAAPTSHCFRMAVGGWQLGAEGGMLENAAVATLRDYR